MQPKGGKEGWDPGAAKLGKGFSLVKLTKPYTPYDHLTFELNRQDILLL